MKKELICILKQDYRKIGEKMKKGRISIIIAVYNTEKYIEKCLKSVMNQTYKDIEIIVVNDCSKDKSLEKIQKLQKTDNRIILIDNEKNKGLSYSRNVAMQNATGEYFGFIDSDDYIPEDYYEKMINLMKREKSEVCVCDIKLVYENDNTETLVSCGGIEKIDIINNGLAASCCNKLFHRKMFENVTFSEGKLNEDIAVVIPILVKAKRISYEPAVYYNYVQRNNSIQNSRITDRRFDIFYGVELTLDRIKDYEKSKIYGDAIVFQQLISLVFYVLANEKSFVKRCKWFRKAGKLIKPFNVLENSFFVDFLNEVGRKHKIYYSILIRLILFHLPILASILVSVYNVLRIILTKNVITKDITIEKIKKVAKKNAKQEMPISISAVIPNYNYEEFLYQRIYSILNQKIKIYELIILDDCSSDDSRKLIKNICNELQDIINIRYVFNEKNSGSAFKQWEKSFLEAKGDYVWVCEADDYCSKEFLANIIKPIIADDSVVISYSDTAFINKQGDIIMRSIKPEIDLLKTSHWDNNYVNEGIDEIKNYSFLNCTVANVSSALIKNGDYKKVFEEASKFKQAGDWLFYISIMEKGKIAFCNTALNYYRLHGNNVTSVTKKKDHFNEILKIHKMIDEKYGLTSEQKKKIEDRYKFLKKVWKLK